MGGAEGGWVRGQYPEEDRAWAGRNLLPYETMTGSNYPAHLEYGWGGLAAGQFNNTNSSCVHQLIIDSFVSFILVFMLYIR